MYKSSTSSRITFYSSYLIKISNMWVCDMYMNSVCVGKYLPLAPSGIGYSVESCLFAGSIRFLIVVSTEVETKH